MSIFGGNLKGGERRFSHIFSSYKLDNSDFLSNIVF
jgi:hypothetical protein